MTTIINTPQPNETSGGLGFLLGVVVLIAFVGALLYFGIPAFRRMEPVQVNVESPEITVPAPEVTVESVPAE